MKVNPLTVFGIFISLLMAAGPLTTQADDPGKRGGAERDGAGQNAGRDGGRKPVENGRRDAPEGGKPAEAGKRDAPEAKKNPGPAALRNSKEAKVFNTYDKDDDGSVTAEELAAMKEGKQNSRARREFRKAVDRADKDENGTLNLEEFAWWYKIGRTNEREKNR